MLYGNEVAVYITECPGYLFQTIEIPGAHFFNTRLISEITIIYKILVFLLNNVLIELF